MMLDCLPVSHIPTAPSLCVINNVLHWQYTRCLALVSVGNYNVVTRGGGGELTGGGGGCHESLVVTPEIVTIHVTQSRYNGVMSTSQTF